MPIPLDEISVLYLSPAEADALTTRLAEEVFGVVFKAAEGVDPKNGSVTTAQEVMGRDLFDRALQKFYHRCS